MADENTQAENTTVTATGNSQGQQAQAFTQADVDRIVQERLAKERGKYADYQQLKEHADKWQQHEESQKSELEKLQGETNSWKQKAEKADADLRQFRIQLAAEREAAKLGIVDPEAAYKLADLSSVQIGEDGNVIGVAEAMKALAASKPYLVQQAQNQQSQQGQTQQRQASPMNFANQQQYTLDEIAKWSPEMINKHWEAVEAALSKQQG